MTGNSNAGGPIVGINVAPLVDIALVLLIIFIITAKLVITPSIPLDLPQAKKSEEVQTILSIIISSEGELLANGTPISDLSKLTWLAKEQLRQEPQLRAVISADGGTPHRKVISVLDALRVAGIARVAFGVTAEDENDE